MVAGFEQPDGVAGDLGGGSLELTEVKGRDVGAGDSLPLGGLRLQAWSGGSLKAAREIARERARAIEGDPPASKRRVFYAIGGTWRSLARLHMHDSGYPLHVMHEYRMDPDELDDFLEGADPRAARSGARDFGRVAAAPGAACRSARSCLLKC